MEVTFMEAAPYCRFKAWRSGHDDKALSENRGEDIRIIIMGGESYEDVPAHVIGLTVGGRDNSFLLLDICLGIICWIELCPGQICDHPTRERVLDDSEGYAEENEKNSREEPAWAVGAFFELLKDESKALRFAPLSWQCEYDVYMPFAEEGRDMLPMVQRVYREHGWPDLHVYRKQECVREVKKAMEKRYPDEFVGVPREDSEDCVNRRGYYAP